LSDVSLAVSFLGFLQVPSQPVEIDTPAAKKMGDGGLRLSITNHGNPILDFRAVNRFKDK